MSDSHNSFSHFNGKDPVEHVAEAQAEGKLDAAEIHGLETPGHLSAASDAARDTAALLAMTSALLVHLQVNSPIFITAMGIGWIFWKSFRSMWLGWFRLERLHRVLAQEKWEIDHHRGQERDELRALYAAKGFEGKLLEDVLDVLMADGDRLLKVMVEEELGLRLSAYEHPLKQGLGAFVGALSAFLICLFSFLLYPAWGLFLGALVVIAIAAAISANLAKNEVVTAIVWNIGIFIFCFSLVYFFLDTFYAAW